MFIYYHIIFICFRTSPSKQACECFSETSMQARVCVSETSMQARVCFFLRHQCRHVCVSFWDINAFTCVFPSETSIHSRVCFILRHQCRHVCVSLSADQGHIYVLQWQCILVRQSFFIQNIRGLLFLNDSALVGHRGILTIVWHRLIDYTHYSRGGNFLTHDPRTYLFTTSLPLNFLSERKLKYLKSVS